MSRQQRESYAEQPAETLPSRLEELSKRQEALMDILSRERARLDRFQIEFANLREQYRAELAHFKSSSVADVSAIQELRRQAGEVVQLLQGGSLFGRYARDADQHSRIANRWRMCAIMVLLLAAALEVALIVSPSAYSGLQLAGPLVPLLLLFTYSSVESHNHRVSELNRRRIYLRMAAIESYTRRSDEVTASEEMEGILREFIEQHFIAPELDPNDVSSVGVRSLGPFRFFVRSQRS